MNIIYRNNLVEIEQLDQFEPEHIFKCGQAFRWKELEDSYDLIAHGRIINIKKSDTIRITGTNEADFKDIWLDYFDLNRDYSQIHNKLSIDRTMSLAIDYGRGIRILNQDPFETIITFIISANNTINNIKNSVERISNLYGREISDGIYSFPTPTELANSTEADLRKFARVGFRAKRIEQSARMIADGAINLDDIFDMEIEDARQTLLKLPGVGDKVCDCILLFAFKKSEAFPVDVWIKRVMEELYIKRVTPKKRIAHMGREIFGDYAGFANQYLFYYGREHSIGK